MAAERATSDEAIAFVKKAVAYAKANGKQNLFEKAKDKSSQFFDRDMYLTITDMDAKTLVNGANPRLNGVNIIGLRDADGKYFVKECLEMLKTKSSGWISYRWPDPITKKIVQKSTYFEKFEDVIIGCGVYKE